MAQGQGQSTWRSKLLGGTAKQAPVPDKAALLCQLSELVSSELVEALVATGEIAGGAEQEAQLGVTLERYLVAEKLDVGKAHARLVQQAAWRREHLPGGLLAFDEEPIQMHLDVAKSYVQAPGPRGRPLLVALGRKHVPGTCFAVMERYITYCIEAGSQLCWSAGSPTDLKMVILVDLEDLSIKNLDATALRACFAVLNRHYPERASAILLYKAPAIFAGLWSVVKPFIDPVTRQKIRFVDGPKAVEALDELVGLEVVPKEYGGQAEAVAVDQAVQRMRLAAPSAAAASGAAVGVEVEVAGEGGVKGGAAARTCRQCAGECMCGFGEVAAVAVAVAAS